MFRVLVPSIVSIRDGQCYIKVCLLYLWLLYLTFYRSKNISTCYNIIFANSKWTRFRYFLLFIGTFKCSLTCVCFWKWKCNERERGQAKHQPADHRSGKNSGGSRGMVRGVLTPLSDLTLVWDLNSYMERMVYHFLTQSIKQAIFYLPLSY